MEGGIGLEQRCRLEGVVAIVRVHAAEHDGGARLLGEGWGLRVGVPRSEGWGLGQPSDGVRS